MNVINFQANENQRRIALDSLLDGLGLGAVLIATGVLWLMPEGLTPRGTWLIAVGFILLTINAARYFTRIEMNGFSLVAGIMAVLAGTGAYFGINLPLFPIALVVIGICMLLVPEIEDHSESSPSAVWRCCR